MFSISLCAQNNELYQSWIMQKTFDCHDIELPSNETKWNIEFKQGNKAIIDFNRSNVKGQKDIVIINDTILLNDSKFAIEKLVRDSLVLGLNDCKKFFFVSKNRLMQIQKENFFLYQGDTIYFSTDFNSPKVKGFANYMNYMTSILPGKENMEGDCLVQLQFIVRKNGGLTNSRGNLSCLKNSEKKINKIMNEMAGRWEPMYIESRAVNTLMRIKINHSGRTVNSLSNPR